MGGTDLNMGGIQQVFVSPPLGGTDFSADFWRFPPKVGGIDFSCSPHILEGWGETALRVLYHGGEKRGFGGDRKKCVPPKTWGGISNYGVPEHFSLRRVKHLNL